MVVGKNRGDQTAIVFNIVFAHKLSVEAYLSQIGLVQAREQFEEGGFSEPLPPVMKTRSPGLRLKSIGPIW